MTDTKDRKSPLFVVLYNLVIIILIVLQMKRAFAEKDNICSVLLLCICILIAYLVKQYLIDDRFEQFEQTNRERRIRNQNKVRGTLGDFYVQCHGCGRDRIIEERGAKNLGAQNFGKTCTSPLDSRRPYCLAGCKDRANLTMNFFNDQYVDTDHMYCYNCLMDDSEYWNRMSVRNYKDFPSVNGPPQTNNYTH
jgi:hypothetical protein